MACSFNINMSENIDTEREEIKEETHELQDAEQEELEEEDDVEEDDT
jgi:hypothetical protein